MTAFDERLADVKAKIDAACKRVGRSASEVTLVAVAKTFPADRVAAALDAGVTDIGENRAQELKEKAAVLGTRATWHFIGPLQTNKVRQVVGVAELIHSVDRIGLGEAIARRARSLDLIQDVLVEVNIAAETMKAGVEPQRALALVEQLDALDGLRVRGLMAIPPQTDSPEGARPYFKELAELRDTVHAEIAGADHLSMGMSGDFEVAIEEGATVVRVGRAIFGPRTR
ncbi:MAG: dependent protein [Actinomycetota bacterium]|nr:dependent protein [Actinomycetota bacterium]